MINSAQPSFGQRFTVNLNKINLNAPDGQSALFKTFSSGEIVEFNEKAKKIVVNVPENLSSDFKKIMGNLLDTDA